MSLEPQIRWRISLRSPREEVYERLATPEGRASFWAERAEEGGGRIDFRFPGGERLEAEVLESVPPERFSIRYFGGSRVVFTLEQRPGGGCELCLEESGLTAADAEENRPGWVSVLLALKAAVDFGVDLRSHDPERSWKRGYVDN